MIGGGIKNLLLDWLFPRQCVVCGRGDSYFCLKCQSQLHVLEPKLCVICNQLVAETGVCVDCREHVFFDHAVIPVRYKGTVIEPVIHEFKFGFIEDLGVYLAGLIIAKFRAQNFKHDENVLVIPIPLHRKRLAERGFNQSSILARQMAEELGLNFNDNLLRRTKSTAQQAKLDRTERIKNLTDAFSLSDSGLVAGKTMILVDDVMTSGTTMNEAAKCLKAAGASTVIAAAVAHN
ncbi:TPA: hypothetical protein DF272_01975 [Candidatus Falkowbacteria bacterium]|nr:hypothetical protein [Candidatus Falkowbacteria bacterium]